MNAWTPHKGQQEKALRTKAYELLYGGARGGGKTDAGLAWLLRHIDKPYYRALVIRKNADDLSDWVDRAGQMYRAFNADIAYRPAIIRFPSGATIRTGHLKDSQAYTKYQGHEYQRMLIEELTQIPDEKLYLQLIASCRSTHSDIDPRIFATTNPGNIGHAWVKKRFVDPAEPNTRFIAEDTKRTRVFIPSTIDDNPTLVKKDPGYVQFLDGLKFSDEELWKAWRLGDWDTFAGQFFREWNPELHTVDIFEPASHLPKYGGVDWGYSPRPFVFLAAALEKVPYRGSYFNRLWVYREVTGTEKNPEEWAEKIKKSISLDEFEWIHADPSINIKQSDGSLSILDQFMENGVSMIPANNNRVNGWQAVRKWLTLAPDGLPYLIVGKQCKNLIEHIPTLVYDENNKDDLDTDGLDDESDALRYMLIHLKWIDAHRGMIERPIAKKEPPTFMNTINKDEFM